jgi:hypothetical protein
MGVHLNIMPFFGEAIPNHFRQFFGGYLRFLHRSVPLFPQTVEPVRGFTNPAVIISLFHQIPITGAFCGCTCAFLSAEQFCVRVWRVSHTERTNEDGRRGSGLPKAHCWDHVIVTA